MSTASHIYHSLKGDKAIWLIVGMLSILSVLAVYSAAGSMAFKQHDGNTEYYLIRQMVFLILGFGMTYLCYKLHYMFYSRISALAIFIVVPMLIYTIFFGPDINDARRWIMIPWIDQSFQTSDLAKLVLIVFVARSISRRQEIIKDFKHAFVPIIIPITLVCALIIPADLSTGALLFVTCLLMMFIGRVSARYILLLIVVGALVMGLILLIGQFSGVVRLDTWITRIQDFMFTDGGYQVEQSKIAIANGGWFGVGPGNSFQRHYLPTPYADFIYAIICEEYGIIGGVIVLGLYLWLLFRCIAIVTNCPKAFGAILAMGLCFNLVIQAFANIMVSVNLLPVTGLTLPLVSMGGTSILFTGISLGIILSVSRYVEEAKLQRMELSEIEVRDADSL